MTAILVYMVYGLSKIMFASPRGVYMKILRPTCSQGKLEQNPKQIPVTKYFCTAVLYKVWTSHTKFVYSGYS